MAHVVPARSRTRSPGRAFWGQALLKEDLVDLARNGKLSLELADAALGRGELERHVGARARDLALVDLLLLMPISFMIAGNRVVADDDLASEAKLGGDTKRAVDAGRGAMDIDDLAGEEDPPKGPR